MFIRANRDHLAEAPFSADYPFVLRKTAFCGVT